MKTSELVAWSQLVDSEASETDVASAELGPAVRSANGVEELKPSDPRFASIFLGFHGEPPRLESIAVRLAKAEKVREDQVAERFGAPDSEAYKLDAVGEPPERATFYTGASGNELCLTLSRDKAGLVKQVRIHVVRPLL